MTLRGRNVSNRQSAFSSASLLNLSIFSEAACCMAEMEEGDKGPGVVFAFFEVDIFRWRNRGFCVSSPQNKKLKNVK